MTKRIALCGLLLAICHAYPASANWERRPVYIDDGMRMTLSFRGGFSYGKGTINNELGSLVPEPYWYDSATDELMTQTYCGGAASCAAAGFTSVGQIDIASLPAAKDYDSFTWTGAVAAGFTVPRSPQWRIEANWEHIAQTNYNAWPMFKGDLTSTSGMILDGVLSGGVYSTLASDIITGMIYYDFFDGCAKPSGTVIPYIGFGIGYASSRTVFELTDLYGDLSSQAALQGFGEVGAVTVDFYTSAHTSGNFAGALALGFSYGLMDNMFLDAGLRMTYIPQIAWALNNQPANALTGVKHKDIFSAQNVIYASALIGLRFEF
jgi:hypothetical protein